MVAESIAKAVRDYLAVLQEEGVSASFGVIYGSQARGDAGDWSDIDLIVVSPYFDTHRDFQEVRRLWVLTTRADTRIEPIACGLKEWEEDDSRAIIEIARREGEKIFLENSADAA